MRTLYFAFARLLFVLLGVSLSIHLSAQELPATLDPDEPQTTLGETCSSSFGRLVSLLGSQESTVRVAAAECLGTLGDKRAVEPLVRARFAEKIARYIQVYEDALRTINDPHTADLLLDALKSPETRWEAAQTLGNLQISRGVDPLLELLKSTDVDDRRIAADSLGPMKDRRAVDPLCAVLNAQDEVLRRFAAAALGKIGDTSATDSLIAALQDPDDGVRWNAANSLGDLRDGRAVESLSRALDDDYRHVQEAAADSLGKIGDSRAVEALAVAIKSGNRIVQMHSAAALAGIREPQAEQALVTSLKEGKLTVVAAAYAFFIRKGDAASIPALIQALNEHGDLEMARGLMFCGNSQLEDAARDWAKRNKEDDMEPSEDQPLVWGSEK